jgi:putative exosortase-associated protein (TIGR04073 family)
VIGLAIGLAAPAVSADYIGEDGRYYHTNGPMYEHSQPAKMTRKLGRGVMNVLFFWVEIPTNIAHDAQQVDFFTGVITGTGKGIVEGGRRLALGVFDVVTFPIEIPRDFENTQETEFVFWDDLD